MLAGRLGRWTWPLAMAGIGVIVACAVMLAASVPTHAAPSDAPAARTRDEDVRPERFLPPAAAIVGILGVIWAIRRRDERRQRWFAIGAALLTTTFAIGPLVMIEPRPLNRQPSPDAQEYADAAHHLALGDGYITTITRGERRPPRYPPGFSLALAPFSLVGAYPANVQTGAKVYAVLYILATLVAGWVVGGPLAAAVAVALVGSSPFAVRYASLVMSDAFAAALTVLTIALVQRPTGRRLVAAGLLGGAGILVRLGGSLNVVALLPGVGWRARWLVVAGALVGIVALAGQQWATFGNPLMTGYQYWLPGVRTLGLDFPFDATSQRDGSGVVADSLDGALVAWVCPCPDDDPLVALPNIAFYPLVLLGVFWIFTPPLTTIPGLIEIVRRWREPGGGYALWLTILTTVFYLIYFYQGARFVAGPATLLAVYSGVAIARWIERLERSGEHAAPPEPAETRQPPAVLAER
jgi:hypothetical protein